MSLRLSLVLLLAGCASAASAQRWDVPLDTLVARVAEHPDAEGDRRVLADRLVAEGDFDAATVHLRQLVGLAPSDAGVRLQLAQVLSWSGREREAIEAYDAVLALEPAHASAALELARLLTWNDGAERAVALLQPLARRQPDAADVQSAYAYALHAAGSTAAARRQYDRALRLAPDDPTLLAESGSLERWEGNWALGRSRLQQALERGLDGEAARRAQTLLDGLERATAPRVELAIEHAEDSNGLTRVRTPSRVHLQLTPAWAAGVRVTQERLSQLVLATPTAPAIDAATTFVSPYVAFSPTRRLTLRAHTGLQDIHNEGSGMSGTAEAEWRRTAPRYLSVLGRVQSEAGVDGVGALGDGIRVTVVTAEGYAEPREGWGLGVSVKGTSYSDDNARYEVSSSTRVGVAAVGPVTLGLLGGAGYEDTAEIYPGSDPYWTPNDLLTVLGGGWVSVSPLEGITVEPEVYTTFQRDPNLHSLSLGFRVRASVHRGRHQAGFLVEQSGSDAYSVQRAGLTYGVALW